VSRDSRTRLKWSDAPDGYWIRFDYNADFIDRFKRLIPYKQRKWDGDRKAWWISKRAADDVQQLADDFFGDYRPFNNVVFNFDPMASAEAYIELQCWPGAPIEVAEAAYEALVKLYARERLDPRALHRAIAQLRGLEPRNKAQRSRPAR